jgi:hypothetical protein
LDKFVVVEHSKLTGELRKGWEPESRETRS